MRAGTRNFYTPGKKKAGPVGPAWMSLPQLPLLEVPRLSSVSSCRVVSPVGEPVSCPLSPHVDQVEKPRENRVKLAHSHAP